MGIETRTIKSEMWEIRVVIVVPSPRGLEIVMDSPNPPARAVFIKKIFERKNDIKEIIARRKIKTKILQDS